jgi:hypothetical protein
MGKWEEELRLPLVKLSEKSQPIVRQAMVHAGLIN